MFCVYVLNGKNFLPTVLVEEAGIVGVVTRLRVGRSGVRIPTELRDFSLIQNIQADYGPHPASYLMGTGEPSRGWSGQSVKLTSRHLAPRSIISGALPPLPLYASMSCKGATSPFSPKKDLNTVKQHDNM
jgi:hypothetical protein